MHSLLVRARTLLESADPKVGEPANKWLHDVELIFQDIEHSSDPEYDHDGTKLFLIDDLDPEDLAMLQALYSRSAESVETHLGKVAKAGYNHKSIADCGSTTMFLEGVSTLAAKAVQDWPLYSGQETSTRFIDMSKQRIVDPVGSDRSGKILDTWMTFYRSHTDRVMDTIRARHPRRSDEDEGRYERAVKARSFDILRGFLPAGITTQLSWHTNLRQAGDHLSGLAKHPADEVRNLGMVLQTMFAERYPSSGVVGQAAVSAVVGERSAREAWEASTAMRYAYEDDFNMPRVGRAVYLRSSIDLGHLHAYEDCLRTRPRGCVLPHCFSDIGQVQFMFNLDFGSFRDIQRHRNGVCRMPLLTTELGFEPWYLDQLDEELRREAVITIDCLQGEIEEIAADPVQRQYYTALGFRVPCRVTYGLPAALYVMELRSSKTVHPTLRRVVHSMIHEFKNRFPDVTLHADTDPDDWTLRRGDQTITAKK
jgi:thymidylate synthase ThyX